VRHVGSSLRAALPHRRHRQFAGPWPHRNMCRRSCSIHSCNVSGGQLSLLGVGECAALCRWRFAVVCGLWWRWAVMVARAFVRQDEQNLAGNTKKMCVCGLRAWNLFQLALSRHGVDTTFSHNARCIQHVSKLNIQSKQVIA
jgi:hypothetical protein